MERKMNQKVSIIILNWNGWEDTIECLESLYQINYPHYNIIIVDNASDDDSIEKIQQYCDGKIEIISDFFQYKPGNKPILLLEYEKTDIDANSLTSLNKDLNVNSKFKSLILLKNDNNDGFAEGNNVGIRFALNHLKTDYFLLLNNDTVVDPNFLDELVKLGAAEDKVGILGPKVYDYSQKDKISVYGGNVNFYTGRTSYPEFNSFQSQQNNNISEIDYISGCSLLIKKDAVLDAGLLNTYYFLYYEDTEWCFRVKNKGYKIMHVPKAKIWHKFSPTSDSANGIYYLTRNRFFFMRENANTLQFVSFLFFFVLYFLFHHLRILVYYRDIQRLYSFYRGIWDGLLTPNKDFMGYY
jgi:GT2 family glycosyltransferase